MGVSEVSVGRCSGGCVWPWKMARWWQPRMPGMHSFSPKIPGLGGVGCVVMTIGWISFPILKTCRLWMHLDVFFFDFLEITIVWKFYPPENLLKLLHSSVTRWHPKTHIVIEPSFFRGNKKPVGFREVLYPKDCLETSSTSSLVGHRSQLFSSLTMATCLRAPAATRAGHGGRERCYQGLACLGWKKVNA